MRNKGFIMYYSYLDTMCALTDEEFGRLVRAALKYGAGKNDKVALGNERFLFGVFKYQIDAETKFNLVMRRKGEKNEQRS